MNARLCATVTGRTTEDLRRNRDAADGADLVELRLDHTREIDVAAALAGRRLPVIVTCRPVWEGGRFDGSEEERLRLLRQALALGAEFVDVEWGAAHGDLIRESGGRRVVLSLHAFDGMPSDLEDRYRAMRRTGAEVVKVAVRVSRLTDLVRLRDLGGESRPDVSRQVLIGMGPAGLPSRLLPDRFGSRWTYAGTGVAPGQIALRRMRHELPVGRVGARTELFGVLGAPLDHSLSPAMHNAGFARAGRDAFYLPLEAADVDDFLQFARWVGVQGVSVTAPFKERILPRLSRVDELSRRVGACNTLRPMGDGWEGMNTDVDGFLTPLRGRIELTGLRASVLGAGGAARSVAAGLAAERARVTIHARDRSKATVVAALAGGDVGVLPPPAGSWDLLVNTTPVGTHPDVTASPLPGGSFDGHIVYDLVYNPPVTRLLRDAATAGCTTVGGLDMLVAQAERQFAWWTGEPPGPGIFRRAAETALAGMRDETSDCSQDVAS